MTKAESTTVATTLQQRTMGVGEDTFIARLVFANVCFRGGDVDFLSKMNRFVHLSAFKNVCSLQEEKEHKWQDT